MFEDAYTIKNTGVTLTTGASSSAATALPQTGTKEGGWQDVEFTATLVGANASGLPNTATAYTATITVDGTPIAISMLGNASQTFTAVVTNLNTNLGAAATASLVGTAIRVISSTTGSSSTVSIVDSGTNKLFSSLTGYSFIETAFVGTGTTSRVVRVLMAGGAGYIKFGGPSVVCTANDIMINTNDVALFSVAGFTHFAVIQEGSAQKVNVVPIEW